MSDRIRPAQVAQMTSLSIRKVQEMAKLGEIPSAERHGKIWDFDRGSIQKWISDAERASGPDIYDLMALRSAESIKSATGGLLDKDHILENAYPAIVYEYGIYFLIREGKIIYVGQSRNRSSRIITHSLTKVFDHWFWIPCSAEKLNLVERAYINEFLPDFNQDPITKRMKRLKADASRARRKLG